MNLTRKLPDCVPPGVNARRCLLRSVLYLALFLLCGSFFVFLFRYSAARSALYETVLGCRLLRAGAQIVPLSDILRGSFLAAPAYFLLCLADIGLNLASFYRGSKSIYLMRRLPDRWELPRRCAALPLLALAAGLVLTALLICLCNLLYFRATPQQCLPAGEHFLFWRAFG